MVSSSRVACILLSLVFVALVILPIIEAACPHNCSGNGRCSHNTCSCNSGYAGSDCSIRIVPIQSGEVVEDGLNTFTWKYYSIVVPPGTAALNVTTEQTNQLGDVDTYIARGTLPTFSEYMVKDISTKRFYVLSIPNPPPGTYYIGQYAYFHVEYSMHADIIVDCTLDCGENGSCVGNTCQCNTNWSGDTCNVYDELLYSGQIVYNTVANQQWLYYHISVGNKQTLAIHVEQPTNTPSDSCDVDVYVNKNEFPTMFDFDYANATVNPITELSLRDPGAGIWYIGIYGYHGCQFSIVATVSDMVGCIGECSRHGSCNGNTCYCTSGFSGDTCQEKIPSIQYGVSESGFVGYQTWNYYHIETSTSNNIMIAVSQESSSADCDLFVRRDSKPSNFEFDYSDLSSRQYFNVTIVDPGTATWWIGVYGWTDCAYSLVASIPTTCACGESSRGRCPAGSSQCLCDFGWSGVACDQQENLLANGEVYDDSVTLNHWTYYRIAANASAMLISMKEVNTVGRLWLFASLNGFPALDAYEKADISTKSDFHEVHFVFPHAIQNVYYIGVYGSPFSPTDTEMSYRITAWAPPF